MLNSEWRNLAENAQEFTIRASNSGMADYLVAFLGFICMLIPGVPMLISIYNFNQDDWTKGFIFLGITILCIVFIKFLYSVVIRLLLIGLLLFVVYSVGNSIYSTVEAKIERESAAIDWKNLPDTAETEYVDEPNPLAELFPLVEEEKEVPEGYKAVPCDSPTGSTTCVVKEDENSELPEQPEEFEELDTLPMNTNI